VRTYLRTVVSGLVALGLGAGALAPAGATDLEIPFDLAVAPKPVVSAGSATLASATLANGSSVALTGVEISFDLPAGSFRSGSPGACTAASGHVTCHLGNLAPGETAQQFVTFTAPTGVDKLAVASTAAYGKAKSAPDRRFTRADSDATGVAAANDPNRAGTCASAAGTLATDLASGAGNPQSTSVDFSDSTLLPCTPVSVGEQERTPANPGCPPSEPCTTQVSFVTIPALPEPATVTITFERQIIAPGTTPKNFVLWETPDKYPAQPIRRVKDCPLQAGEDSCIVDVSRYRRKGIQVELLVVGTGDDPRYAG
jgi:hypothetical protein